MSAVSGRRWLVPAATLVLLVAAAVALTLAIALSVTGAEETAPEPGGAVGPTSAPAVPVVPDDDSTSAVAPDPPVTELADPDWVSATAATTKVPERALAAYAGASIAVTSTHPGCGLGWNTLAAIGQVESEHGSIGGAQLDDDGTTSPPILGVPLDGDGVAAIRDTDRGRLDGDQTWDRAVGPMQFIPATWKDHATDGNGDGRTDVHNIDDAALSAAAYLCSGGDDLTQPDSWIAAIGAYNPDTGYGNRVADVATRYAEEAAGS